MPPSRAPILHAPRDHPRNPAVDRPAGRLANRAQAQDPDTIDPVAALTALCDGNDAGACTRLGDRLLEGEDVARDEARGVEILFKACQLGDRPGCNMVGFVSSKGTGRAQSTDRALAYYAHACHGGEATACSNLGLAYISGEGAAGAVIDISP